MENLTKSMKFQFVELKDSMLQLWGVILVINIIAYILNFYYLGGTAGFSVFIVNTGPAVSVAATNIMIIVVSLIVVNFQSNYEIFPLGMTLGMTRQNYYISYLVKNVAMVSIFATIQAILLKIDPIIIKLTGRIPLDDFAYFNIATDSIFYIIFVLFIIFLGLTAFWNLIASINYKFGYMMWIVLAAVFMAIIFTKPDLLLYVLIPIGKLIDPELRFIQIVYILLIVIVLYVADYFVVRQTDVKKGI